MNNKRQTYGVYVDLLGDNISKANKDRVTSVREQIKNRQYRNLAAAAEQSYAAAMDYIAQYGYKAGTKMPSVKGKRYHLLCTAQGAIFLTNQYHTVDADVRVCLQNGTPTTVFAPYKTPDMVKVTSISEWNELLNAETAKNRQYYTTLEYAQWEAETRHALTAILNTQTPWLGDGYRLHTFTKKFQSFAEFLQYAEAVIADIETMGEWDIELTASMVMNEKASTATYVAGKGTNKGMRTFWCKEDPEAVEYWYNYEVLPADICMKFLHLTYLKHIGYKPLKRVMTNGSDFSGKELWFGTALEDMVRTTPLYVDPYSTHDVMEVDKSIPEELHEVVKAIGLDTINKLGYEEALKAIRYNLTHK